MKYNHLTLQDFLQDDSFVRWMLFGEDALYWEQFPEKNPEAAPVFRQAGELVLKIKESQEGSITGISQNGLWERIQETLLSPAETERKAPTEGGSIWKRLLVPAGVFVLLLAFLTVWLYDDNKAYQTYEELVIHSDHPEKRIEKHNPNVSPLLIELEDGSTILLRKNGKVSYPNHFNNRIREVILSGEAFFKISENPGKPFYVYTNGCVTKVLGTSFEIKSDDRRKQVTVNVRTGSVSVFSASASRESDPENKGIILTANQQAIFDLKHEILTRTLVDEPQIIKRLPAKESQYFEEAPVVEILKTIEHLYGLNLIYNEEKLANCFITTTLTDDPLYEQLNIICKTIGATFHEVDGRIVIESGGCR